MQKTNFDFEIIIGEDNSTDKTLDICKQFVQQNSHNVTLISHQEANKVYIDGMKTGRFNLMYNLYLAKGKYIIKLDGDDYFIDDQKFQKQIDALEKDPEATLCYHLSINQSRNKTQYKKDKRIKDAGDLLYNHSLIPSAVVHRRTTKFDDLPKILMETPVADLPLHYLSVKSGKVIRINEYMMIRNIHEGGAFSGMQNSATQAKTILTLQKIKEIAEESDLKKLNGGINRCKLLAKCYKILETTEEVNFNAEVDLIQNSKNYTVHRLLKGLLQISPSSLMASVIRKSLVLGV